MGIVIAYGAGHDPESLRNLAHGAGLECAEKDAVKLEELDARLPQVVADIVIVVAGSQHDLAVEVVEKAAEQTSAPILVAGPGEDRDFAMRCLRAGAKQYLDIDDLRNEIDAALDILDATDDDPRIRGTVIAVYSPTNGSGTTTIAANLAGALAKAHPGDVALIELSRRDGDLALFFDFEPEYSVEDACERWQKLDATSLGAGMVEHESGVAVLAHKLEQVNTEIMTPEAVRRITVLLRSMFRYTVVDLDTSLQVEQLEAMRIADEVVFVLRPDVPAVRRAQRVVQDVVDRGVEGERIKLLVNRWGQSGQLSLRSIAETLEIEPFQLIPDDPRRVNVAINRGLLLNQLSKSAPISRRFAQLAGQLNGKS